MRRLLWFVTGFAMAALTFGAAAEDYRQNDDADVDARLEDVQERLDGLELLLADTPPRLDRVKIKLVRVASLPDPVDLAFRPGDTYLYVATRPGVVYAVPESGAERRADTRVVLDISRKVDTKGAKRGRGGEAGLLGITFSPDGQKLYAVYTAPPRDGGLGVHWTLAEYEYAEGTARRSSERKLVTVAKPRVQHSSGCVRFGPDGYLYFGLGDSWPGEDKLKTGQDPSDLLASIMRIDPRPGARSRYTIPRDNPFVRRGGAPEVWAFGVRNPWRFSFDRVTGDLWLADVGEHRQEEINVLRAAEGLGRAANLGWRIFEGTHAHVEGPPPPRYVAPVYTYGREGGCAIIGGFRYRGLDIPPLRGAYVFGDLCQGELRMLSLGDEEVTVKRLATIANPTSFAEDADGEPYVLSLAGGIYRIDARDEATRGRSSAGRP